jgi:hypothetical protein
MSRRKLRNRHIILPRNPKVSKDRGRTAWRSESGFTGGIDYLPAASADHRVVQSYREAAAHQSLGRVRSGPPLSLVYFVACSSPVVLRFRSGSGVLFDLLLIHNNLLCLRNHLVYLKIAATTSSHATCACGRDSITFGNM